MAEARYLVVTADDFGIGPNTSRGILDLAEQGVVTASVLLVNSPFAEEGVRRWDRAGRRMDLGWHPCLTIDAPILPPEKVPGLVDARGRFQPLGKLLRRLLLGRVRASEIEDEFRAQYRRFRELTGQEPALVNSHHHLQVFAPVGAAIRAVLDRQSPRPYIRCVRESAGTLWSIRGARPKRAFLNLLGRRQARRQRRAGFPGNDWLTGITDPPYLNDPEFFPHWLRQARGRIVELTCHPGHFDATLNGRDGSLEDGQIVRRPRELELLRLPGFRDAIRKAGFTLMAPSQLAVPSLAAVEQAA